MKFLHCVYRKYAICSHDYILNIIYAQASAMETDPDPFESVQGTSTSAKTTMDSMPLPRTHSNDAPRNRASSSSQGDVNMMNEEDEDDDLGYDELFGTSYQDTQRAVPPVQSLSSATPQTHGVPTPTPASNTTESPASVSNARAPNAQNFDLEAVRAANIKRNHELMQQLELLEAAADVAPVEKQKPKPRPKPRKRKRSLASSTDNNDTQAHATRPNTRLKTASLSGISPMPDSRASSTMLTHDSLSPAAPARDHSHSRSSDSDDSRTSTGLAADDHAPPGNQTQPMGGVTFQAQAPASTSTPQPPTSTSTPQPPLSTSTPQPPPSTSMSQPPPSTSTPQPFTSTSTSTPQPPTSTSTPQPPLSTSTPQPPPSALHPPSSASAQSNLTSAAATPSQIPSSDKEMQGWPQWIRPQVLRLKSFTLGSKWDNLVLLWLEIEKELGFPTEVGSLDTNALSGD